MKISINFVITQSDFEIGCNDLKTGEYKPPSFNKYLDSEGIKLQKYILDVFFKLHEGNCNLV